MQECTCGIKLQLKKCRYEKMQLEKVILYLKDEMQILSEQLGNLQNILVSATHLNIGIQNQNFSAFNMCSTKIVTRNISLFILTTE